MPVGRFRADPRELDDDERAVAARQYPEGIHALGSLIGLSVPQVVSLVSPSAPGILQSPIAAIGGLVVGGVGGYLLGEWYRRRAVRQRKAAGADGSGGGA